MNINRQASSGNKQTSPQSRSFRWPFSRMRKESFEIGTVLFRIGDIADKMYFIRKGRIRLIETGTIIQEGDVIGEMGIFSPFRQRTASAVCENELEAYTMEESEVLKFLQQEPDAAFSLIQLSIGRFIENLKREIEARERIESELRVAAEIQADMLPGKFPPFPERSEFEIFAIMEPAKEVGGDFYDFFFIDPDRLCFVIGDISGKGVPAALFMAITKTIVKSEALRGVDSGDILRRVNTVLCHDNEKCMFATIFCAILNMATGELQFSNGGHNPPIICSANSICEFIDVPKSLVIGAIENTRYEKAKLKLNTGDLIFLYTDGVTEAANSSNVLFTADRLKVKLSQLHAQDKDVTTIIGKMREELIRFTRGAPQSDDITMLALTYKGKGHV